MPEIRIFTNGDGCWPDLEGMAERLADGRVIHSTDAAIQLARLPGGMKSGASSVTVRIDLPDGRVALIETSLAALKAGVGALVAADEHDAALARGKGPTP